MKVSGTPMPMRRLRSFINRPAAGHEDQRNAGQVHDVAARLLARYVAGGDVSDLVRHHAGQFGFIVGRQNQAGVHIEEAAGQARRR